MNKKGKNKDCNNKNFDLGIVGRRDCLKDDVYCKYYHT